MQLLRERKRNYWSIYLTRGSVIASSIGSIFSFFFPVLFSAPFLFLAFCLSFRFFVCLLHHAHIHLLTLRPQNDRNFKNKTTFCRCNSRPYNLIIRSYWLYLWESDTNCLRLLLAYVLNRLSNMRIVFVTFRHPTKCFDILQRFKCHIRTAKMKCLWLQLTF